MTKQTANTTMIHKVVTTVGPVGGQVMLCVHNAQSPAESEWKEYVRDLGELPLDRASQFVYTLGGAPNGAQRHGLVKLTEGRKHKVAVVSPSAMVRSVCTALSWFNKNLHAFSPDHTHDAFEYLGFNGEDRRMLIIELRALCEALGGIPLPR